MTTGVTTSPRDTNALLFPHDSAEHALLSALDKSGATANVLRKVERLSAGGRRELLEGLAQLAAQATNSDVPWLVVRTLQASNALRAAGRRTAAAQNSVEIVKLFTIPVSWSMAPAVELFIDGVPALTIEFDLKTVLEIEGEATVRRGYLTAFRNGRCTVTVTLACAGVPIATKVAPFDPATTVALGRGIPLVW